MLKKFKKIGKDASDWFKALIYLLSLFAIPVAILGVIGLIVKVLISAFKFGFNVL